MIGLTSGSWGWITYIADFAALWWGEVLMVELGATGVADGEVGCVHFVFSGLIEKTSMYGGQWVSLLQSSRMEYVYAAKAFLVHRDDVIACLAVLFH